MRDVIVMGANEAAPARAKPNLELSVDSRPSTKRTVVIVCKSEQKWTPHKFSRIDHRVKGSLALVFKCHDCDEERVYGIEG